jgi:hypothetical protein
MAKIGILFCGYRTIEYIDDSLTPWIRARAEKLGGNEFVISAVSAPFIEYKDTEFAQDDGTQEVLRDYYKGGHIDYLEDNLGYVDERTARNAALKHLLSAGCEWVLLVDSDEAYLIEEIYRIAKFVDANPFAVWFRGSLKNYVFDDKTYLRDAFTPARIYRTRIGHLTVLEFRFDNEVVYQADDGRQFDHLQLPCVQIPKNVAFTRHLTWISNAKSKSKLEYQKIHFKGAGPNSCSYRWNDAENKLEFNPLYYAKMGLPIPELVREN